MKCPNCEFKIELGSTNLCPHCGVDMMLFTKTIEASDILYNKGLARAKIMDLTGAIDCLSKSVQFNKENYLARNLLGLIYFEVGRVGDALKHWVISSSKKKEDNPAVGYLNATQKDFRTVDKYNEATKMYNQALVYLKQKSDDIAIIQLKKAVDISPKFIDALNMLALCYLIQKDKTKSLAIIERVLAIDANNNIALNYYNEIFPSRVRPDSTQNVKKMSPEVSQNTISQARLNPSNKKSFGNTFHIAEILSFIIGGLCMLAVIYILIIPSMTDTWEIEATELKAAAELTRSTLEDKIAEQETTIDRLTSEGQELRSQNSELSTQLDMANKIRKVNEADLLSKEGKMPEAVNVLYNLDTAGLPSDMAEKYNSLKSELYPKVAKQLYDEGVRRFNAKKYDEAVDLILEALIYEALDDKLTGDSHYYLGYSAEENGEEEAARLYYETVVNDYPTANRLSNAKQRLNNLNN